jgi:hypothetical protein
MIRWKKLGQVFETSTYAQTPTPLVLDDRIRVYIAERDERGKAFISYVDVALDDPTKILGRSIGRVLPNGNPGTFDDEGQMPSFAMRAGATGVNLYYSGWNTRNTVPYHNATGIAASHDAGETFFRQYAGPILDRTHNEPYLAVTPCIYPGVEVMARMLYISGLRWEKIGTRFEPIYSIFLAYSSDGVQWGRRGVPIFKQLHELECFSRPWVIRDPAGGFHCWYSFRSAIDYRDGLRAYRIGYAHSNDGWIWERADWNAGIQIGEGSDFDNKMICYPAVAEARGRLFMFYNGNTFGRFGFGVAEAQ